MNITLIGFTQAILLGSTLCLISGCAGVGILETKDPMVKLAQARELEYRRPLASDRLIHEARRMCEERKDNSCLAATLQAYGRFLNSNSFDDALIAKQYTHGVAGFLDASVTLSNRREKGLEYLTRARSLYLGMNDFVGVVNLDNDIAATYWLLKNSKEACAWYDRSLEDWKPMIEANPNVPMHFPKQFATYQDYIAALKKNINCTD